MEGNSIKTFENLCKIFEMKIRLNNAKGVETPDDVTENYEKYAQKIDAFYNEEFQKELKNLISPKETLDEEKERLEKLINLLEERLAKRSALAGDFHSTTGKYIKNLQLIVSETELNNKKERLSLITRYIDTTKEIESIKENIEKLKSELNDEEVKKEEYISKNKIMEDELYSVFVTNVNNDDYYHEIEEENILNILTDVSRKATEAKETLDITKESVESLLSSGMNDEYESYIEEASKSYSLWKDREIILKIYKAVISFEEEFREILSKRVTINSLLEERKTIVTESADILLPFEKVMLEQENTLNNEKEILENISNYTSRITFKEERLKELEDEMTSPDILAILKEYHMIDTYEDKKETYNVEENIVSSDLNIIPEVEDIDVKEYNPYTIVSIEDYPKSLNIGLAKIKGASVRDKVNKKLNPELVFEEDNQTVEEENNEVVPGLTTEENTSIEEPSNANKELKEASLPVELKPDIQEKTISEELPSKEENAADSSFWIPVSDTKLETSEIPNIEIPVINNNLNSGDDNFGFPESNN